MKIEYIIWGGWSAGTPDYELSILSDGKLHLLYGGPGYYLKDCKRFLRKRHPKAKIKYKYEGGEWNVDVIVYNDESWEHGVCPSCGSREVDTTVRKGEDNDRRVSWSYIAATCLSCGFTEIIGGDGVEEPY